MLDRGAPEAFTLASGKRRQPNAARKANRPAGPVDAPPARRSEPDLLATSRRPSAVEVTPYDAPGDREIRHSAGSPGSFARVTAPSATANIPFRASYSR